jgi:hypothetical protein
MVMMPAFARPIAVRRTVAGPLNSEMLSFAIISVISVLIGPAWLQIGGGIAGLSR